MGASPWKDLVIDDLYKVSLDFGNKWGINKGVALCVLPGDQQMRYDFTTQMGGCTGLYYSLAFQLPKWGYVQKKMDEWMDVSPMHPEMYNVTVAQKQKLEQTIKQGLASAAQAVADYELARHDLRKYKEIVDYFKMGKKDEHVLRALFVDRVDSFTGEGYSMITMVKRWPTMITDFIRLSKLDPEERKDVEKIKDKLQVTQAEGTVLKTKNILFEKWKEMFFPEVKDRYARIKNLVKSRERSVDEYRNWLKPYVARFKMMNETLEKSADADIDNVLVAPGFGLSTGASGIRFVAWVPFTPPEMARPERPEWGVKPWDKLVEDWAKKIEKKYDVKIIGNKDFVKRAQAMMEKGDEKPKYRHYMYYNIWDIQVTRFVAKTPTAGELENIVFDIWHRTVSQNIILIHCLEILAQQEQFNKYVKEMIGDKSIEDEIRKEVEEYIEGKEEGEKSTLDQLKKIKNVARPFKPVKRGLWWIGRLFVKRGPYESNWYERVTKMYCLPAGQLYARLTKWLDWKMKAIGSKPNW